MPLYFAYGSNMNRAQMAQRCPGAQGLGPAILRDWEFAIHDRGVATVVKKQGSATTGVLWKCSKEHLQTLDVFEGVASGLYERHELRVELPDGSHHKALVYIEFREALAPPRPGYLERIVAGAREHGLCGEYVRWLEEWSAGVRPGWNPDYGWPLLPNQE